MFGVLETSAELFGHWTVQSSLKKKYVKKPPQNIWSRRGRMNRVMITVLVLVITFLLTAKLLFNKLKHFEKRLLVELFPLII